MSKNTKDRKVNSHAKVDLVRNPFLYPISDEVKQKIESGQIDESIFVTRNQYQLYNNEVSFADEKYMETNEAKESANVRYVKVSSEIIPNEYLSKLIIGGARSDEDFLVPYDYYMVTRKDGTQFLISECLSIKSNDKEFDKNMHRYSVLRYMGKREGFKEDIIYSEGLDLARLVGDDQEYIDIFADEFLSEKRLNESLMTTGQSLDAQKKDETDHAEQYVGYINPRSLKIESAYNEATLPILGKKIRDEVNTNETRIVKYSNKLIDRLFRAIRSANDLRKRFKEEVTNKAKVDKKYPIPKEMMDSITGDPVYNVSGGKQVEKKEKDTVELPVNKNEISAQDIKNAIERFNLDRAVRDKSLKTIKANAEKTNTKDRNI